MTFVNIFAIFFLQETQLRGL